MPYQPYAPSRESRSWAFHYMWYGAASAVLVLIFRSFAPPPGLSALIGFAVGGVLGSAFPWRSDDYFRALCASGHRAMAAFLAVYVFLAFVASLNIVRARLPMQGTLAFDAYFIALMAMAAFYAGYAYAWLRGRF